MFPLHRRSETLLSGPDWLSVSVAFLEELLRSYNVRSCVHFWTICLKNRMRSGQGRLFVRIRSSDRLRKLLRLGG